MAKEKLEINDFGCDYFVGREIFKDGDEDFVSLNLQGHGSVSSYSLDFIFDYMCYKIKAGEKILLYKSPGEIGPRKSSTSVEEIVNAFRAVFIIGPPIFGTSSGQDKKDEYYTISGRRYEPLKPEHMNLLKIMYELDPEMKEFPSPFKD